MPVGPPLPIARRSGARRLADDPLGPFGDRDQITGLEQLDDVAVWEAQLTAVGKVPMTGVPIGKNPAREIAVDYAEANFALAIGSESDNPFSSGFSSAKVTSAYNEATAALQKVLNACGG